MLDNCFLFRVSIQLLKNIKMQKFISFTLNVRSSFCASVGLRKIRNKLFSMNPEENLSFLPSTKLDWSSTRLDYQQCVCTWQVIYCPTRLRLRCAKYQATHFLNRDQQTVLCQQEKMQFVPISLRMWMRIFFTTC